MQATWQTVKGGVRNALAEVFYLSNLHRHRHKGKAFILTYHRVLPRKDALDRWVQPGMFVDVSVFEQHMQFLKSHFQVISLAELLDHWQQRDWERSARYCVITFDDGWLDNYLYAYPVLKRLALPATIFLPTDFVGTDEWFWPEKLTYLMRVAGSRQDVGKVKEVLHAHGGLNAHTVLPLLPDGHVCPALMDDLIECCKWLEARKILELTQSLSAALQIDIPRERVIVNWEEVKAMSGDGMSFGSHSRSHRILTTLSVDEVRSELEGSGSILRMRSSNYVPVFCYPNGNTNKDIQSLVKEHGYQAATGVRSGVESCTPESLFDLRRISIHNDVTYTIPLYSMRLFTCSAV